LAKLQKKAKQQQKNNAKAIAQGFAPTGGGSNKKELKVTVSAPPVQPPIPGKSSKRGQHGRKKKLKEKYKFQDEEERELRMQLLQAKPKENEDEPASENSQNEPALVVDAAEGDKKSEKPAQSEKKPKIEQKDEFEESSAPASAPEMETTVLGTLTGCPVEEDELLFAVPVIGPYASMQNYKYRIKLIPGSTKRGKAARNALDYFLRDKNSKSREKDLLKSVKDQDLARNFPGKVKLSAPGAGDKKKN